MEDYTHLKITYVDQGNYEVWIDPDVALSIGLNYDDDGLVIYALALMLYMDKH